MRSGILSATGYVSARLRSGESSLRVLIVDDSFLMRRTIRRVLENDHTLRCVIDEAKDGQEALDKIKSHDVDVILLDIEMPVMDGIEFMKRARIHTEAIVIVISSLAQIQSVQVEKALFFGAQDVVAKPTGITSTGFDSAKRHEILDAVHRAQVKLH